MKASFHSAQDPQGLRRPRFSFFIFTCQTARSPKSPSPHNREPSTGSPSEEAPPTSHRTTNDNRLASAVDSLILVRSFTGTKTRLGRGPRQRRAQWGGL